MMSGIIKVSVSVLQPKPKASADNTYLDLDYSRDHKTESNNCFIIHCFKENKDKCIMLTKPP